VTRVQIPNGIRQQGCRWPIVSHRYSRIVSVIKKDGGNSHGLLLHRFRSELGFFLAVVLSPDQRHHLLWCVWKAGVRAKTSGFRWKCSKYWSGRLESNNDLRFTNCHNAHASTEDQGLADARSRHIAADSPQFLNQTRLRETWARGTRGAGGKVWASDGSASRSNYCQFEIEKHQKPFGHRRGL